jgi:L-gulonate 5-dehydrogenase
VQACRRGQVQAGELALVLGCGPIGLAIIEVALAHGARPVAVDLDPGRLAHARDLGAETVPAGADTVAQVLALTRGEGAPVVLEATGSVKAMEQTIDLVAAGGRIVIVGLVKRGVGVTFPGLDLTRKEVTIVGSRASTNCFPEALDLLASGRTRLPALATEISMWDAVDTFRRLGENPAALHKGILTVPGAPR